MTPQVGEREKRAAHDIVACLRGYYGSISNRQTETIICAAAAITGEWSSWAVGYDCLEKDKFEFIKAFILLFEGDGSIAGQISAVVDRLGANVSKLPHGSSLRASQTAGTVEAAYPSLSVDNSHYPNEWPPIAAPRFRERIKQISRVNHLSSPQETLSACGLAVAILVEDASPKLDPIVAATLALEVMTAVSCRAPLDADLILAQERQEV
ncbi:hypothetical protein SAMN06265338_1213 [Rhodoblastus acidophilus]|uniref:Uncharacterized protein n=1 Tax=Rhodoblastus acidophilus TaxID=1074 RepID=A0A212SAK3_RHOAC|nr:hypothetical protein [Rhodoblastus acidophilus]SNB82519.1 hypothetical protein SAMN06265338_1213 [Rhodoblastus acidophilus]